MRHKLATYSLNINHRDGGPKAKGFVMVLGITIESIAHLESKIHRGIRVALIKEVVPSADRGLKCVLEFPVRGAGAHANRRVNLRTIWHFSNALAAPRLVTAFLKP